MVQDIVPFPVLSEICQKGIVSNAPVPRDLYTDKHKTWWTKPAPTRARWGNLRQ